MRWKSYVWYWLTIGKGEHKESFKCSRTDIANKEAAMEELIKVYDDLKDTVNYLEAPNILLGWDLPELELLDSEDNRVLLLT